MASWSEIMGDPKLTKEVFDIEPFKHANLEEEIDLMMSTMMKVHKSLHDKIESSNEKNFYESYPSTWTAMP